ncbi:MAG: type I-F CRISPR-associated helicase Cas3, partial [Simplicispira sp.]|nr:type I-F CRISPR-associated helicase Cas3 [Simplicispira sp.]
FDEHLPRLARHKGLCKRAQNENFRWQDKAADTAAAMRERSTQGGAFIVNMASTGCGKTLANARIMYALADAERGMRCAFAMGLRTLTLQTGTAFRNLLSLGDDKVAIRVGGSASRALFEHYERQAEATGSASRQELLDENSYVRFEGNHDAHPLLRRVMHDPQVRALLAAPLLVCTIDHLTPATESERGGRQIAPMLRLMSGDLVLDEPDDFDIADLPALTRLVHWAGLLGARVLLSSATLPPALVQGLFEAYCNGRHHF